MRRPCLWALLTMLLGAFACSISNEETGSLQTESRSVKLDDAKSVSVEIKMGAGQLKVTGGAPELLDAHFSYNVAKWKPEVRYSGSGTQGRLTVEQDLTGDWKNDLSASIRVV